MLHVSSQNGWFQGWTTAGVGARPLAGSLQYAPFSGGADDVATCITTGPKPPVDP